MLGVILTPCSDSFDGDCSNDIEVTSQSDSHDHEEPEDDNCSPLCLCHCCHAHSVIVVFHKEISLTKAIADQPQDLLGQPKAVPFALFHPPRA